MLKIKTWIAQHTLTARSWTLFTLVFMLGLIYPIVAFVRGAIQHALPLNWDTFVILHEKSTLFYALDTIPFLFFVTAHIAITQFNKAKKTQFFLTQSLVTLQNEKNLREQEIRQKLKILEMSPVSYIVLSSIGIIEFANISTSKILGSNKTMGLNALHFSTVKGTPLEASIRSAINGQTIQLNNYKHISVSTHERKILNITLTPLERMGDNEHEKVLMITTDMTYESNLLRRVEEGYLNTVKSLARALDARDRNTSEHSFNVKHYAYMIITQLELDSLAKEDILIAADLHDIGKIGILDSILNKAGPLTVDEFNEMKQHPSIGADLLQDMEGYHHISNIIRYHHERPDGKGYPCALKYEDIPIGSLVIAIADAFDAMITDRVYRKALSKEKARSELLSGKGTQFDPRLVDIFLAQLDLLA